MLFFILSFLLLSVVIYVFEWIGLFLAIVKDRTHITLCQFSLGRLLTHILV